MKDHSYGIVVFQDNPRKYLALVKHSGTDLPKGHMEEGETEEQAALREAREESGLADIELIPGYKEDIKFSFGKGKKRVNKTVTYFLGRTKSTKVKISSEHQGFFWFSPQETKRLKFPEQRRLVQEAEAFLKTVQHSRITP